MIVCHCNIIKRAEITQAVRDILAADPSAPLEPQHIYKELQKRGQCCGCFPAVRNIVCDVLDAAMSEMGDFHALAIPQAGEERLMPKSDF